MLLMYPQLLGSDDLLRGIMYGKAAVHSCTRKFSRIATPAKEKYDFKANESTSYCASEDTQLQLDQPHLVTREVIDALLMTAEDKGSLNPNKIEAGTMLANVSVIAADSANAIGDRIGEKSNAGIDGEGIRVGESRENPARSTRITAYKLIVARAEPLAFVINVLPPLARHRDRFDISGFNITADHNGQQRSNFAHIALSRS